jgi:hypothetical protein
MYKETYNGIIGLAPKDTSGAGQNMVTQAQYDGVIDN